MIFESAQKIRFDDVDGAGILYYPRFFDFCHKAFEDMFDERGPFSYATLITVNRLGFPTVALTSSFFSPLSYGHIAKVCLAIKSIGKSSLVTHYKIHRNTDDKCCFEADITTVLMDLRQHKSAPILGEIRSFLEHMQDGKET